MIATARTRGGIGSAVATVLAELWSFAAVAQEAVAEDKPAAPAAPVAQPVAAAAAPAAAPALTLPDAEKIVVLIRSTLLTLNDAVQTGNFTVLRDVAAPGFRDQNSAARLAQSFDDLSRRGINLAAIAIIAPQLAENPAIDPATGILRLRGNFPGTPVRIDFDLMFQAVNGNWRVFGLSANPVASAPAAAAPAAAPAAAVPVAATPEKKAAAARAPTKATKPAAAPAPAP